MKLASLLDREHIVLQMRADQHWPAIEELVEHMVEADGLGETCQVTILDALREREEQISTGIGSGVAIPHAFSDEIEQVRMVFGRSIKGVEFEAIDNAPVHFVILFVVPKKECHQHLHNLAAVSKLMMNCEIRRQLHAAETRREILDILNSSPSSLSR